MATNPGHTALLDQLQNQVNLVLDCTGKLFAAAHANPKSPPVAQASQLRHVLPSATNRFHEALDQLEEEIQLAKAVMRRDLTLRRERSGTLQAQSQMENHLSENMVQNPDPKSQMDLVHENANGTSVDISKLTEEEDIAMQDVPSDVHAAPAENAVPEAVPPASESFKESSVPDPDIGDAPTNLIAESTEKNLNAESSNEHAESDLLPYDLEATVDQKQEDNPPGNTDLDSLFDETFSVGTGENNDHGLDQGMSSEFDFDSFGANLDANTADNDNISALLPGLQDYANTQPNTGDDVDLSALLSQVGDNTGGDPNQPASIIHRDSTFDDLMDLPNFNGDNDGNENTDLDFDSLFN